MNDQSATDLFNETISIVFDFKGTMSKLIEIAVQKNYVRDKTQIYLPRTEKPREPLWNYLLLPVTNIYI